MVPEAEDAWMQAIDAAGSNSNWPYRCTGISV